MPQGLPGAVGAVLGVRDIVEVGDEVAAQSAREAAVVPRPPLGNDVVPSGRLPTCVNLHIGESMNESSESPQDTVGSNQ